MKQIFAIAAVVVVVASLSGIPLAQQAPKPTVPIISDAHRATYFKAQLQFNQAQQEFQQAQQKLQEAVAVMQADCGGGVGGTDKFQPQIGPQGDPVCVPKPEPTKPAEKK